MAIEHYGGVAKDAVEFDCDAFAGITLRQIEDASIPSDTGFRIFAANRLRAVMKNQRCIGEGKFDGPIMGQVQCSPITVFEIQASDGKKISRLRKLRFTAASPQTKIFCRVVRVAELKAPTKIQQQTLARGRRIGGQTRGCGVRPWVIHGRSLRRCGKYGGSKGAGRTGQGS